MKTLLSFLTLALVGCATTSQVEQMQEQQNKTALRIEEVRLEQQAQFCVMSFIPCILVTQNKLSCSMMVNDCADKAVEVYQKNTGKKDVPDSAKEILDNIKQSMKAQPEEQEQKKPSEDNGL